MIYGKLTNDKDNIVEQFSTYVTGVCPELPKYIPINRREPSEYLQGNLVNSFFADPASNEQIKTIIFNLRTSSARYDDIKPRYCKTII